MIEARRIWVKYKSYDIFSKTPYVLSDVSFRIERGDHVAVLGGVDAGKTTLLRVLCGLTPVSRGRVARSGSVSFPVGFGAATSKMTVAQYILFVAKCYAVDPAGLQSFVVDLAQVASDIITRQYTQLQSTMRSRINMALCYGLPFDFYLLDGSYTPSEPALRTRYLGVLRDRMKRSGIIYATRDIQSARQLCRAAVLLEGGTAHFFSNIEDGIYAYSKSDARGVLQPESVYFKAL